MWCKRSKIVLWLTVVPGCAPFNRLLGDPYALPDATMSFVGVHIASNPALLSADQHRVVPVVYLGRFALKTLVVVLLTRTVSPIISMDFASLAGSAGFVLLLYILLGQTLEG